MALWTPRVRNNWTPIGVTDPKELTGNAAAHLSVEHRRALMRHLNSDLKPLAEGDFSERGPLLFGKDFASRAKSTADNVKALKGFMSKKATKGFSGSDDQNKRKSFQPQGRRPYWGTQRRIQGQRFSVFNHLAPPLRQNPPVSSTPRSRPNPVHLTGYLYATYKAGLDPGSISTSIPWGRFLSAGQPGPNCSQIVSVSASWENSSLPLQLDANHHRPLDPGNCKWVSLGAVETPSAVSLPSDSSFEGSGDSDRGGSSKTPAEGRYHPSGQPESRFLLDHIPSSQKGVGADEASGEFEAPEQVSAKSPLQDGRCACGARSPAKGRLDVQDRPKGRIFCDSCLQRVPTSFAFHLWFGDVPVYLPPVWPCISTTSFHQGPATSGGLSAPKRGEVCDLLGRSSHHGGKQRPGGLAVCCSNTVTRISGLPGELLKVSDSANTGGNLPGSQHRLKERRTESSPSKAVSDTEAGQEASGTVVGLSQRDSTVCGEALSDSTGDSAGSPSLPEPSAPEASGATGQSELRQAYPHISSCQGGPRMVASRGHYMEWEESSGQPSRVGDRDGCLTNRVGSLLPGQSHERLVVRGGTESPHQRARITSSFVCPESISEACQRCQCAAEERQYHHSSVHQSIGRHKVTCTGQNFKETVALVRHNTPGPTSARQGKPQCRLHVLPLERQNRLDSQPSSIRHHQSDVGSAASGSVCDEILLAVAKVFQLAPGSGSRSYRCFLSRLEEVMGLCSSTMVPHFSGAGESSVPEGDASSGNTMLANTAMVSPADGDANRFPPSSPPDPLGSQVVTPSPNCDCPVRAIPSQLVAWKVSGDSSVRKQFQRELSTLSSLHGGRRQTPHTTLLGVNGRGGVLHRIPIAFQQILPTSLNF